MPFRGCYLLEIPIKGSLGVLPYPFQYYSTRLEQIISKGVLNQAGWPHNIHMIKLQIPYILHGRQLYLQVLQLDLEDFICTF